jgi:hypothetical protein
VHVEAFAKSFFNYHVFVELVIYNSITTGLVLFLDFYYDYGVLNALTQIL